MAKKKRRSSRRRARPKTAPILPLRSFVGLAVLCGLVWVGYAGFQDRTYVAFTEAGDGAYERRNYDYAARMYTQSLEEAERIDPGGPKVAASLRDLSRTYQALGRKKLAVAYLERARAIRKRRE